MIKNSLDYRITLSDKLDLLYRLQGIIFSAINIGSRLSIEDLSFISDYFSKEIYKTNTAIYYNELKIKNKECEVYYE